MEIIAVAALLFGFFSYCLPVAIREIVAQVSGAAITVAVAT